MFVVIDAPIQPKKNKSLEVNKMKSAISKQVNKAFEQELREKALEGKTNLIRKKKKED